MKLSISLLLLCISGITQPLLYGAHADLRENPVEESAQKEGIDSEDRASENSHSLQDPESPSPEAPSHENPPPPPLSDNPFYYLDAEKPAENVSDTNHLSSEVMKLVGSVVLFTVILLLLNWMLKRINSNRLEQLNATSEIRVLEKRVLSHKAFIYLLEIRGKTVAIAESPGGIAKLAEFIDGDESEHA